MSITPAFSPGPWITHGALVGSVRKWIFEDLYEQCSFHMAEKMPSSVIEGSRPISPTMRRYSSGVRPCAATSAGLIFLVFRTGLDGAFFPAFPDFPRAGRLIFRAGGFFGVLVMSPKWIAELSRAIRAGARSTASCGRPDNEAGARRYAACLK